LEAQFDLRRAKARGCETAASIQRAIENDPLAGLNTRAGRQLDNRHAPDSDATGGGPSDIALD
jgi:hypothetical protein